MGVGLCLYHIRREATAKTQCHSHILKALPYAFLIVSLAALLGGALSGFHEASLIRELRKMCIRLGPATYMRVNGTIAPNAEAIARELPFVRASSLSKFASHGDFLLEFVDAEGAEQHILLQKDPWKTDRFRFWWHNHAAAAWVGTIDSKRLSRELSLFVPLAPTERGREGQLFGNAALK